METIAHGRAILRGRIGERVVHVVVARNSLDATCVAVTAYEPTAANWETELRTPKR